MKLKYFLIGGLGLMLVGGLLAVGSYRFGDRKSLMWENGPKLIDMVQDSQKIPATKKIDKLVIHAEHQQVEIIRGFDFEVQSTYEKVDKPHISIKGQTLSIEGNAKKRDVLVSMEDNTPSILLTVPKDWSFSEIKLEGEDSNFSLAEMSSEKIRTKTYGGSISFDGIEGKSAEIDDNYGNVTILRSAVQQMAVTGRNSYLDLDGLTTKQSTLNLENSYIDLFSKQELGLDIQFSGNSQVTKNDELLALKTTLSGKEKWKITGYDSMLNIYESGEYAEN